MMDDAKIKLTMPQALLLDDLYLGSLWMLGKGEHRPMNHLIKLGFATKTGGEWKITAEGRKYFKAEYVDTYRIEH